MSQLFFKFSFLLFALQLSCNPHQDIEEDTTTLTTSSDADNEMAEDTQDLSNLVSTDDSILKYWDWSKINIPAYEWSEGTAFGNGLYVDIAFDPQGVAISGRNIRFYVDPLQTPPQNAPGDFNYRSEIRTVPWSIKHPIGTEQWIGWVYTFGEDYVFDTTSPITIFQNHPGVTGLSPQFELEIAALNTPSPAQGGEIQIVNEANSDRIVCPVRPAAGEKLSVVIQVIYGLESEGLLKVWLNGEIYYNKQVSTVYEDYPWGGNNKWGVYHHTFNDSPQDVQSSLDIGAGKVELLMSPLRMLSRNPQHPEYRSNAYQLVRPEY